ncbi:ECF transporter S component [Caloranaerobacter azorensis]|uniref:Riboflavin transporter n=3 Tax=Caloranaerobacter azorensis TaxID=116090 RepID=A0A1M5U7M7_9FIRM|nr:ECF transporter S component [Caloranaerobacter azorensis]KGG81225.1 membrane protein [Caloranaerobacter azorensis H53214]QIB27472.1 ECF transporter S component [Caloranaerobacter azorensis]SHH58959.1 Riboflavin transporter FmnP [Caloranaerobacter azorensis DSM 13643]
MLAIRERLNTRMLTKISVLSVLSFLIMYIEVPLWFTPEFLKIDLSDIPALIGAFALGPMAGVMIEFVKNILHLVIKGTSTMGVGELANFLVGSALVYTAGYIYFKNKTFKGAILGMVIGTVMMTLIASLSNYYFLIPFYAKLFGAPVDAFVEMGAKVNKFVADYKTFILFAIVPFNLLKGVIVSLATILLYKRISPILHR